MNDSDHDELSTVLRKATSADHVADAYDLVVEAGPRRGARFAFDGTQPAKVLLGESPACNFRLHDALVSRRHASLEQTEEGLLLTDLSSKNGTFVNGVRIAAAYLLGSESVQLGGSTIRVHPRAEAPAFRLTDAMRFGRMVGASPEMRRLYPLIERVAASNVSVVVEGETGTGKEVLAEALHDASPRARGPFVVFDCTAVPPTLLESTLFGHERGAFTGALAAKRGVFEEASGGTLFIDEIGELEVSLQSKLLRAIERGEVQRVGSAQWTKVDVRVIAATRRDLDREVQAGRFRDDLFYRLAVTRIELPPLRRRRGDVGVLARHFWHSLGGGERPMPPDLIARLEAYPWPGNVRELHNTIARTIAIGELALEPRSLDVAPAPPPDYLEHALALNLPLARARDLVVDEFERRYVRRVLERYGGNVGRAAAASGIARRYFQILRARHRRSE